MVVVPGAHHKGRGRVPKVESGLDVIDIHVGSRLKLRRSLLGMSQSKLGESVGLTFQQIQKYERGANGIAASRLWQLADVLNVPVSFFFDGMPVDGDHVVEACDSDNLLSLLGQRETLELVQCYYRIKDPKLRKRMFELMKALVSNLEAVVSDQPNLDPS